ncbi:GerAB/ArcD/ProY family transporter [Gracilibacillus salitolerans]|uniref:GerAB/ArcD/ProY family transporter n=1 Tax=Gracilibacillus salitolerans TaxID=2663022 RepID=UPI0012FDCB06|nr:GerAB/ArcD/ProY family transporter [Gracilibacillus salitolerans]
MEQKINQNYLVSTFFVFFLIHSSQTGIGLLSFQNTIIENAGHDSWISVIITGLSLHIILWMILKMVSNPTKDLLKIHQISFGEKIGNFLSVIVIGYFLLLALTVFRTYIEAIQVWVFPMIKTWELSLGLACLIIYIITGGFRTLTGISFLGVVLPSILLLTLYFPLQYANFRNLMPVFNHSILEIAQSSKASSLIFIGFESLLIYFPFIKHPSKSAKWAHGALAFTTFIYLLVTLITFVYFSQGQLKHTLWPTLAMIKIVEFTFIMRIEFIFIFTWLLVILPTVCIPIWCCTRILKKITKIKPRKSLYTIMLFILLCSIFIDDHLKVDALRKFTSEVGFYFIYSYIPLLFAIYSLRKSKFKSSEY